MISIFGKDKNQEPNKPTPDVEPKGESSESPNLPVNKLIYPKPKILLIGMQDDSETVLKSAGFKIDSGSFGESYNVEKSSQYEVLENTLNLPNCKEQEVIVIDLAPAEVKNGPSIKHQKPVIGNYYYYQKKNHGVINTRPVAMFAYNSIFDNILKHGGVFIIFANARNSLETVFGKLSDHGFNSEITGIDNWSFLPILNRQVFDADYSEGTEISVKSSKGDFYKFLTKSLKNAHYICTLKSLNGYSDDFRYYLNDYFDSWLPLATDKYGNAVAGAFVPKEDHSKGWVFIFPQIENKATFLLEFLRDILPEHTPELFPYSENHNWIEGVEYQPKIIRQLHENIEKIESEAKLKIEKINEDLQKQKDQIEYQNRLLTDDGDSLVKAVKKTFEVLGFSNVLDVDEELAKNGVTNSNAEDLQIRDKPTSILVEVKGVVGNPKDDDVFQVTKHVPIRMKEWKEFDVKALSIINHQKGIPALTRNNQKPFRDLILESASEQNLGVMTACDLYRLVRSYTQNSWNHEQIKDLFLQSGHISIVPLHYQYVGVVEHFWEKPGVVGIRVEENSIQPGDIISFELPLEFEEMKVDSLQVENKPVEIAEVSMLAGIKTNLSKEILKKGVKVFRVSKH